LALQHHPEKNPGDQVVAEMFLQIAEAYDVLSDGMPVCGIIFVFQWDKYAVSEVLGKMKLVTICLLCLIQLPTIEVSLT